MPAAARWGLAALAVAAGAWVGHLIDVRHHEARAFAAGQAATQGRWDAEKVTQQAAALKAQQANAAETERRQAAQQEIDRVHEKRASQRRAALAAADARAADVQLQLAAIAASAAAGADGGAPAVDAGAGQRCEAARTAAAVLAELLGRAERRARAVVEFADQAADAGAACVSAYESLKGEEIAPRE